MPEVVPDGSTIKKFTNIQWNIRIKHIESRLESISRVGKKANDRVRIEGNEKFVTRFLLVSKEDDSCEIACGDEKRRKKILTARFESPCKYDRDRSDSKMLNTFRKTCNMELLSKQNYYLNCIETLKCIGSTSKNLFVRVIATYREKKIEQILDLSVLLHGIRAHSVEEIGARPSCTLRK
ncbi:hypothetical protein V1477_011025 [Vespula maculifrons]|uniref:Uncharacterized protein n=1 Tax=Vespula maculifrons TaxID=7453 RepID=A0ABD2C3M8_VESMC